MAGRFSQLFTSGFRPTAIVIGIRAKNLRFPKILKEDSGQRATLDEQGPHGFHQAIVALLAQISRIDQRPGGVKHRIIELDRRPLEVALQKRGNGPAEIRLSGFELFADQGLSSGERPDLASPEAVLIGQIRHVLPKERSRDRFRSRRLYSYPGSPANQPER